VILPLNRKKSANVADAAEKLYDKLVDGGVEVLIDDRDARPGVMFGDADLLGMPHRVVLSERSLARGNVEYQCRRGQRSEDMSIERVVDFLLETRR
jgi:prolyl-tRNA synthetase